MKSEEFATAVYQGGCQAARLSATRLQKDS